MTELVEIGHNYFSSLFRGNTVAVQLRDYQEVLVQRARDALRTHRRVLIQSATGSGKTALATFIADATQQRGGTVNFICHRAELVEGTSKTFHKFGVHHGFVASGMPMNGNALVNVCSIDTLKTRLMVVKEPKVAIWDECHHMGAKGWQLVQAAWPNAKHIGLSATPWRLDGTGLGDFFDVMVMGPSVAWLIENGFLSQYRVYAPHAPDMKGAKKSMGDFAKGDAEARMDKPKLTGDAIAHWRRHANGMRTVVFAVTIAHSKHIADQFNLAGIAAAHLDGGTPKGERKRIIQDYAAGRILVLCNVDLFGEGFDLASIAGCDVTIDCVMLMRPTQSLSLFLQMVGRALRPALAKIAIILDHAGNTSRHGFPDDEREWSLEGREKGKGGKKPEGPPPPITCDHCFMQIRRPLPEQCPSCGKRLFAEARLPDADDGELQEVTEADKRRIRAELKREEAEAKDLGALIALGSKRGYKNPVGWAHKKFSNSPWRKALGGKQQAAT
ncbi:type III restriction enzyme, res subunit [Caballeronia fortuita]|uniref:Type III restriction enzyme, res subunit n=2 Tax=Caballeronia fortuita TaxID=1777138 RepID=A0A158E8M7_9BURK|nr:type III restriction enzyme, res subunit [Caballeronia fortuita]